MLQNFKMPDSFRNSRRNREKMHVREYIYYGCIGMGIVLAFAYFFYRSYLAVIIMSPFVYIYIRLMEKENAKSGKWKTMLQFKEMLTALNASLQTGYSIENALMTAYSEMKEYYGDDARIVKEMNIVKNGIHNNIPVTSLLFDMAKRTQVDEIYEFAEVYSIAKKTGGNVCMMVESFVSVIDEKVEVMQEIETMISAKKFEQKIMNVIPFFIIFYVELTSKGFFSMLYHNAFGIIVMTIAMCLYLLSVFMAKRIIEIQI